MFSFNTDLAEAHSLWTTKADGAVNLRKSISGPGSEQPETLPKVFQQTVTSVPDKTALVVKRNNVSIKWTYRQYYDDVIKAAKSLIKLGVQSFHTIGILGFNSPEWAISHMASVFAGGIPMGMYNTSSAEAIRYMAHQSEANVMVVEDDLQLQKILQIWDRLPQLKAVVQYTGIPSKRNQNVYTWEEFIDLGTRVPNSQIQLRLARQRPNKCCSIIYTSGTTGDPKGVMISHDNCVWTANMISKDFNLQSTQDTVLLSYLPLSHIAGQMVDVIMPIVVGGTVYFAQPDALKGSLIQSLHEAKPTWFFGVPRVWEKIVDFLVNSVKSGKARSARSLLGLDRCRVLLTGAAPIAPSMLEALLKADFPIREVYGMSECTGPHTYVGPDEPYKIASVGREGSGMITKLPDPNKAGEAEVCFYGRHVFMGYLKLEDKTREAIDEDGWLHSGDIGRKDSDGFLYITGRIKELVITAGGENIAPYPIEDKVKEIIPIVSNCMVIGDKRKFLSLLITLKTEVDTNTMIPLDKLTEEAVKWCRDVGSEVDTVSGILKSKDPKVYRAIQDGIHKANIAAISHAAWIQKWEILPQDFSMPGGELGPTLKLRRPEVLRKYQTLIESFYQEDLRPNTKGKL